jgi:hypothetical protein
MRGRRTRILKKYNRQRSRCYSKKSKRHTRKNVYSKTYKKIQKGAGFFCKEYKKQIEELNKQIEELNKQIQAIKAIKEKNEFKSQTEKNKLDNENRNVSIAFESRIARLRTENYRLTDELEKLKKQKLPTEEQINAVTLDENDNTEIEKMLDSKYINFIKIKTEEIQVGDEIKIMSKDEYKKENREKAIREYKIKKLMGENSES